MKESKPSKDEITPEHVYLNRRVFLQTSIFAGTGLATTGVYRIFRNGSKSESAADSAAFPQRMLGEEKSTSYKDVTNYNNFYEFSTDKESVAQASAHWSFSDWNLEVGGLVEKPLKLTLPDIRKIQTEERVYRFRCVEGWSMIIPWQGFPLSLLLERAKPLSNATHVAFETYFNLTDMPNAESAGLPFPYVEGLRLDEAMNPLTLMATGLYGKNMPNQNGAPIRLVVPWKYGFKSIKSVVKIVLTDKEPPTSWNLASPNEYGFYSNVNPSVDHPRWTQKTERRIGELGLRETLPFNGYDTEVASMYQNLDLKKYF